MSKKVPQIIGPILANQAFIINTIINDESYTLYPLNSATYNYSYLWVNTIDLIANNISPAIFTYTAKVTAGKTNFSFQDTMKGNIGLSAGYFAFNSQSNSVFNLSSNVNPWDPPNYILSRVSYSISDGNSQPINVYFCNKCKNQEPNDTITLDSLYFLSTELYVSCSSSGNNSLNDPASVMLAWYCDFLNDCSNAFGVAYVPGWTNQKDCQNNVLYSYCENKDYCGTNDCNGPCKGSEFYLCENKGQNYKCQFNPSSKGSKNALIITGVVLGVLILVFLVLLLFLINNNSKKKQEQQEQEEQRKARFQKELRMLET